MIKMPFQRCRGIFHQSELRSVEDAKIGWKGVYSGLSPTFLLLKLPKLPDSKRIFGICHFRQKRVSSVPWGVLDIEGKGGYHTTDTQMEAIAIFPFCLI